MALKVNNPMYYSVEQLLKKLDVVNVERVYSGKPGCMCGCNGKYSYSSTHVEKREDWQGKVSDKAVAIAVNKLQNYIQSHTEEQLQADIDRDDFSIASDYVCVDIESEKSSAPSTRRTAIYFKAK